MIKPNVPSWRTIQPVNIAEVGRNITKSGNRYGFNSSKLDSHAMKNSEWALPAYLSQSKYGKIGNRQFSGVNKEIYINKSNNFVTGCSYGSLGNTTTDYGCQYTYEKSLVGTGASTTGSIYGIYDMSGGAWEYMMGNYAQNGNRYSGTNQTTNSGYTGMLYTGGTYTGKSWLEDKYYNFYTSNDPLTLCDGISCIGQLLHETSEWYGDYASIVVAQRPWSLRSGCYNNGIIAGAFCYNGDAGSSNSSGSFRLVLSVS